MSAPNKVCEFEEREFESRINSELTSTKKLMYVPGLVKERHLGIDVALLCRNRAFWRLFSDLQRKRIAPLSLFPYFTSPEGIELDAIYWACLQQSLIHFPAMKFNLFLQHKRPLHVRYHTSGEWPCWYEPYFRFEITTHQQLALEDLSKRCANKALVAYASPAFATLAELWDTKKAILPRTNFVKAEFLSGHHLYTYKDPGSYGQRHSDSSEIRGPAFESELERLAEQEASSEGNLEFLLNLSRQVDLVVRGSSLSDAYNSVIAQEQSRDASTLYFAFLKVGAFCSLTNTSWMIGF